MNFLPTSPNSRWPARSSAIGLGLVLLLTFLVYLPAVHGRRLWDDDAHITRPGLQSLDGLYRIWFEPNATQQYYPLLHSAFWIEHKLWGDSVLGYHLVSLLWHLIATSLVYLILRRLEVPGALFAAAIFALHPVMVESVAWISEQKNTLSAVFYLTAMYVYLGFDVFRRRSGYSLAFALFFLGLLTKTVTATLPAALLVIFWWKRGTLSLKRDVAPLIPFFVFGAVAGLITARLERTQIGAVGADFELSIIQRGLLAGRVIWFYIAKLIWPSNLIFIYPRWQIDPAVWWQWIFPAGALLVTVLLWLLRRYSRAPLAACLFFCGTLFPVLGFLNVYPFIFSFVADHFQYLASLGVIVFVAAATANAINHLPPRWNRAAWVACVSVIGLLAALTMRQSKMYADSIALWKTTLDRNPSSWMAHNNLGSDLYDQGDNADAIELYRTALRLRPQYADAQNNLAVALMKQGANEEAAAHLIAAQRLRPADFQILSNLGTALLDTGRPRDAAKAFSAAIQVQPSSWAVQNNLGRARLAAGEYDKAIESLSRALELKPNELIVYNDLADAYFRSNRLSEAVAALERALNSANERGDKSLIGNFRMRLNAMKNRNNPEALKTLGFAMAKAGHFADAAEMLQAAHALKPNDVLLLNALGLALISAEKPLEAVPYLQAAIELKPTDANLRAVLGQALLSGDKLPDAIAEFEQALALNPKHPTAHAKLGDALLKSNRAPDAISHLKRAIELQPRDNEARVNLAVALAAVGENVQAREQFASAIQFDHKDANAYYNHGKFLAASGQTEEAIHNFRQAVRLQPAVADFHQALADALWSSGRRDEAIEYYQAALRRKPGFETRYANLAKALAELNRPDEAIATSQDGMKLALAARQPATATAIENWLAKYRASLPVSSNDEQKR